MAEWIRQRSSKPFNAGSSPAGRANYRVTERHGEIITKPIYNIPFELGLFK